MAEALIKPGTEIVFGVTGSFSPADSGTDMTVGGAITNLITLASLADGAGRQSDKIDLGATRAKWYSVSGAFDFTGETPAAVGQVRCFWAPSPVTTQGNGNVAGNSGADAAAPGGALGSITLAEFVRQCQYVGALTTHDGAAVQCGHIGVFSPAERYGQLIVVNEAGDAFEADDVENHVVMRPIIDDIS